MSKIIKPKMVRILNSLSVDTVLIKKGTFMMGEGSDRKEVTIKEDFYMGKYPITIAEYMHFANDVKAHYPEWKEKKIHYYEKINLTDNAPIIGVSWHDAVAYCKWLSEKTGDNYRLPREAEWEYACRAGTTTKWSFGDDEKELEKYAWYKKNSDSKTHEVGKKLPNPWGLYDMHGNVLEWCEDWYNEDKDAKVLRGGSWYYDASLTRSAYRFWNFPTSRGNHVGFRLLRILPS
jgi:formylglycine-generating enzyme required for sulfatase activity